MSRIIASMLALSLCCAAGFPVAAQSNFTAAETEEVKAFLREHFADRNDCMVIGLIDARGSHVFGGGSLDNGTTNLVNGDSVFFIGSITKTFTDLLLQEMADRAEVRLDDPVAKYLPRSVTMPARNGREITLLNLATHTAGFPHDADNMTGKG